MVPLLQEFIAESREQIERAAGDLSVLDNSPGDAEAINGLFRAAHTIKGSCRLFPLDPVARLVGVLEDLLDAAREREIALERHHLDLILQGFDTLEGWFDQLAERGELDPGAGEGAEALAREIRQAAGQEERPAAPARAAVVADCAWLGEVDEGLRIRLFAAYPDRPLVAVLYEPEAECFYAGEDPLYSVRTLPELTGLAAAPCEPWPALEEMDIHRCRLRLFAFSTAGVDKVREALGTVRGVVAISPIGPAQLALPAGEPGAAPEAQGAAAMALQKLNDGDLEGVRLALSAIPGGGEGWLASSLGWISRLLAVPRPNLAVVRGLLQGIATGRGGGPSALVPEPAGGARAEAAHRLLQGQAAMLSNQSGGPPSPGRLRSAAAVALRCVRELGREDLIPALEAARDSGDGDALGELVSRLLGSPPTESVQVEPEETSKPEPEAPPAQGGRAGEQVRIELNQVDRLMDLVSELVVAKNSLPYLARQAEAQGLRDFARGLKERYANIHRIVEEMQATISAVRLVPLAHGFRRLPRLVRDAGRRVRKEVALILEGEAVEADRRVVDALGEPLVHLVRNAVDHGIEAPERREVAGKPRAGQLRVAARAEGDRLLLEVADDGGGIDIEAVKRRAYERGLIGEEALGSLGEDAALQLLFQPGFSTRGTVTEMSGRGVGLDVVRTAVQSLGGSVSLTSRPGEGSRFLITVPLSMATAEVMMIEAAGQHFGIPLSQVAQTLKLPREGVRRVKRRRAFVLREKVVPLIGAREALGLPPAGEEGALSVLLARLGGGQVGLEVDRFGEVAEVVMKPLDGVLAGMRQYAGSAVLADGSVLLVLDLGRLVGDAGRI